MKVKMMCVLLSMLTGIVSLVSAQTAVTVGSKVASVDELVSGTPYLIKYTSMTGTPYITEGVDGSIGAFYSAPNAQNSPTTASVFYFFSDGSNWKIENAYTGNYWPTPTGNATLVPTTVANAGSWAISISSGTATLTCNNLGLDRLSNPNRVVSWSSRKTVEIYTIDAATTLSTAGTYPEFSGKDIVVSSSEAASLSEGQWYVMKNRGRNGYAYETSGSLKNQAAQPSGPTTSEAKSLVRLLGAGNGKYYIQTGLGNFFGVIPQNTAVPTTVLGTEPMTIGKINNTDGHFYIQGTSNNIVLDCQENGFPVVGWGSSVPTSTGGNNDWAFYPVSFDVSWIPAISEVYIINNTNASRGAMMYAPSQSTTYVWSSGKNSQTFNGTNANCQWVFCPTGTDGQYYLYNVGAGKFAIPATGGTYNGYNWIFSSSAVAVNLVSQSDGTYKIHTASGGIYAAVSNNYMGPIINYNDIGGNFTITQVSGDQSAAASAAVAKLVRNQTALATYPQTTGWYAIQVKTANNNANAVGRYLFTAGSLYNNLYPLTFTGTVDIQPSISDATYFTHLDCMSWDNNYWQLPDGRYLVGNSSNKFPTTSSTPAAIIAGYDNGNYFKSSGNYYADPYTSSGTNFIGETSYMRTAYNVYPIDLSAAGLTAWQMVCDNAPETQEITCSRTDVSGLSTVYKGGYIFLPSGVTPTASEFTLEGSTNVTVNTTDHIVTFTYDPNLAMVAGSVEVSQGWQTAGRDAEVMLLRITASPFQAATGVTMNVNLKDGTADNISQLTLYEASTSSSEILSTGSGAPTKTAIAQTVVSGSSVALSMGSLSKGTHYYWIAATVKSDATLGSVLDAEVASITYTCNNNETTLDLTAVGDPADRGAMVFNVHTYPFLPRDNGSRVYRIPAMVVADDGSIVVACDKRYESYTDIGGGHVIDIVVRRSTDGGKTWSSPVTIAKGDNSSDATCGYGDPSLIKGHDGTLYCFFGAGNIGYFYGLNRICMSVSTDNGVTWSTSAANPPADLVSTGKLTDHASSYGTNTCYGLFDYFVTSGRGLCTSEGYLMGLLPAQAYTNAAKTEKTSNSQDFIFYSTDQGATWHFSENAIFVGGDEAKVIQTAPGQLLASVRQGYNRGFNTATYTLNADGTLTFTMGSQWNNSQLSAGGYANNQDIFYYQRAEETHKTDLIFHSMTTAQHANLHLYYSTDQGQNWTEFLNVQTKGARYVTMEKSAEGSLYLFYEDQSLNSAGGYTDYNHYPLNFLEITREQLLQLIPTLDESSDTKEIKVVYGTSSESAYGSWSGLTWTSNNASGMAGVTLTLSDGTYNRFSSLNGRYNLAYHPAAANTQSTLTLTAPAGYIITGYSVETGVYQAQTYTLTAADGTTVSPANLGSTYTPLEIHGLNALSTTITVTTTDASKWLSLANFTVRLAPAPAVLVGDIDRSGIVDGNDLLALVGYLVGKVALTDINEEAADVNGDGRIGLGDVTALVNLLPKP